jgi:simple sugar transport system ATP-binding protein
VDQPSRGLDVAAVEAVWSRLRLAAADGIGILVNSSDLDEVLHLASRILVMARGRIVGEVDPATVDAERLGLLIGGSPGEEVA